MAAIPRCTRTQYGIQVCRHVCVRLASVSTSLHPPSTSLPSKFQDFTGPCTLISRTSQDQTHFPGLSRSWKFYKHFSKTFQEARKPCWFGGRQGIRRVKLVGCWCGYLSGADLHMAQLMPLPLTVSCFSKIQIGFTFQYYVNKCKHAHTTRLLTL